MPDRVHAGVEPVQISAGDPMPDRVLADPYREKLPSPDDPVLPSRDPGKPDLRVCAGKCALNASFFLHTPRVAGLVLREGDEGDG
jgi:hypothetical protein